MNFSIQENFKINTLFFRKFNRIFWVILIINFFGIIPFSWTIIGYIWNSLFFRIFIWVTLIISFNIKFFKFCLAHFLPIGRPNLLWFVLILLEVVRHLIRPLTLRLRVRCNLIAGHVLINLRINLPNLIRVIILFILFLFELSVCLIQRLVYLILINLYLKDYR